MLVIYSMVMSRLLKLLTILGFAGLVGLLSVIACWSVANAAQVSGKTLIVGSEEEFPPFSIGYTDDAADGFTVELWRAVADKSGLAYTIRVKPFKTLLTDIKTGDVDVLINLAQSDERRQFVDFTIPHVTVSGGIFVRKSTSDISSEHDLSGKTVIVLNGDLAQNYAKEVSWGKRLILVDTAAEAFSLLASGKHDAIVISKLAGEKTIKQLQLDNVKLLNANVGFEQKFSFAVAKGNSDLLAKINEGMALVKESGEYDAIYNKWFAIYNLDPPLFGDAFYVSITFTVLAVILVLYLLYTRTAERKQSFNLIQQANRNYEELLSAATQFSIIATDMQGMITTFNRGAESLLGYPAAAVIRQLSIVTLHNRAELELRRSAQSEYFKRSLSEFDALVFKALLGAYDSFECEYVTLDAQRVSVQLNVSPIKSEDDTIIGFLFMAQDITERKKLEGIQVQYLDKLRQSEEYKTAILECAPDAIIIMSSDGLFVEFNPAAERMFDYQRAEVIGKLVADLIIPSDHRKRHDEGMKTYIRTGVSQILGRRIVVPALRRDGSQIMIEMTVVPFDIDEEQHFLAYARQLES